jgi:hypothetical protein
VQRAVACLGCGGGSSEPGVARAMGIRFRRDLTLQMRRSEGNSHRGSSSGGGGQSRAHDGDFFVVTLVGNEELLQSTPAS